LCLSVCIGLVARDAYESVMPARTRSQTRPPTHPPSPSPPTQQARNATRTQQPVLSNEAAQQSRQHTSTDADANVGVLACTAPQPSSSSEASSAEERELDTGRWSKVSDAWHTAEDVSL
jgi:hypothetical protein